MGKEITFRVVAEVSLLQAEEIRMDTMKVTATKFERETEAVPHFMMLTYTFAF